MLGEVLLSVILVVVGVDKDATFDLVTSGETVVDGEGECVSHVARILGGSTDGLAVPVSIGSNDGVVGVLDLVGSLADWVGSRVDTCGGGGGGSS